MCRSLLLMLMCILERARLKLANRSGSLREHHPSANSAAGQLWWSKRQVRSTWRSNILCHLLELLLLKIDNSNYVVQPNIYARSTATRFEIYDLLVLIS
jgi:UDP-N-acetylmuramyl pentapeptide phosphotransferase/UDP-N-acetylglucosamine-1-phosphate transferase